MQPAPPTPDEFVSRLIPAMMQAAAIAKALEGRVENIPKSDEATPVKAALTIADTASQEALLVPLLASFHHARLPIDLTVPPCKRRRTVSPRLPSR